MERILILGGAGFMGRHLCRHARRQGAHVTVVDDLSTGLAPAEWPRDLYEPTDHPDEMIVQDVRDFFRYHESAYRRFDTIFHCAAVVGGRLKIEGDPLAVAMDLSIDSEFFAWAVGLDPKPTRVIYFSSSAVYPIELQAQQSHCRLPESLVHFRGTRMGMPDQTYGFAKLAGEYLAGIAVTKYKLPVVIYRPFSGYGEDQDATYPFPVLIRRIINRDDPVVVWGNGDQERDFIHIDDVVEAVFATMNSNEVAFNGGVLNLGSGEATSFRQLIAMAHTGLCSPSRNLHIESDLTKPVGVFSRVADTYLLNQFYTPKISLEEGILRVAAHLTRTSGSL